MVDNLQWVNEIFHLMVTSRTADTNATFVNLLEANSTL